ncbi:WhiB family transcriptional regulator [Actinoallomurus purpureus]|uniref:WhiB family transcriptional regulator n=1 Tax=Actinoallomurus purpureus TaxID=478114 RepID=UPI002093816B|nr:WhiB family transcriptional regulator [Actinoallomurus purpureus]MCO6009034.1 WhiB family transcriptional regulator [Actinoallomurus purpureus]
MIEHWTDLAACQGVDPELFFPVSASGPALDQVAEAKQVCASCPVVSDCLAWALRAGESAGVWGGTTPDERRYLRLKPLPAAPAWH